MYDPAEATPVKGSDSLKTYPTKKRIYFTIGIDSETKELKTKMLYLLLSRSFDSSNNSKNPNQLNPRDPIELEQ